MLFNYILFGIYLLAIILLAGFLIVFRMHLEGYFQYSKYLKGVFRIYLVFIIAVGIFGGYKILTGTPPAPVKEKSTHKQPVPHF